MKAFNGCMTVVGVLFCLGVGFVILCVVVGAQSRSAMTTTGSGLDAGTNSVSAAADQGFTLDPNWRFTIGEMGMDKIQGQAVNNTGHAISYAQAEFTLYDSSGAQVDTALANTANLAPGATWKFQAVAFQAANAKTARFAKLTGF